MPLAMNPAPTIPTLSGVRARSSSSSCRSTINIAWSLPVGGREDGRPLANKIGPGAILVGDDSRLCWPADPERPIVPAHAALSRGRIKFGYEVRDFRVVFQRQKGVGATFRDEQRAVVRGTQPDGYVAHESW